MIKELEKFIREHDAQLIEDWECWAHDWYGSFDEFISETYRARDEQSSLIGRYRVEK